MMLMKRIRPIHGSIQQVVAIALVFVGLAALGLVLWGLDKGLDIKDESYYLLGYQAGQEKFYDVSAFHLLVISRLFSFLNNVIAYRVLSVVVTVLAAAAFSLGFLRMLTSLYPSVRRVLHDWAIGVWFMGASFFWAAGYPLTFSYNVLINAAMLAVSGGLFYLIPKADSPHAGRWVVGWGAGIGLLLGVSALVKPTSAALIALCGLTLLLVCWLPRHARLALLLVAAITGGGLAGLAGCLFGLGVWNDFYKALTIGQLLSNNHVSLGIVRQTVADMLPLLTLVVKYSWILVVLFLGSLFSARADLNPRMKKWIVVVLLLWLAAYLIFNTDFLNEIVYGNTARMPYLGFFLLALCVFLEVIGLNRLLRVPAGAAAEQLAERHARVEKVALGIYLLLLPLATALGTNNPILWQMWMHITPWCALAVLLLQEVNRSAYFRNTAWVVFIALALWAGGRWANIYLKYPYRLVQTRAQQTEPFPIDLPALRGLKVDPPTQKFFSDLKSVMERTHLQPGDEIIEDLEAPGLVLAFGGFSPGTPWLFATGAHGCTPVINSQLDHQRAVFILRTKLPADFIACLKNAGMDFPSQYIKVGQVDDPYIQDVISVYARKN